MDAAPTCRDCGAELICGHNWSRSFAKRGRHYCRSCNYAQLKVQRQADPNRREKERLWSKRWRQKNPDRERARRRRWQAENLPTFAAKTARRRAIKKASTIDGADKVQIAKLYELARLLNGVTGVEWHVDHLHPLARGGAHHQDNLVACRADFNIRKSDGVYPALVAFFSPNLANTRKG